MVDNDSIDYYDRNAEQYFKKTIDVDMTENCDRFIKHLIPGGKIIDIGAGSGRDILYFKSKGFRVEEIKKFFFRAESYLSDFGAMYVSFKNGIITGKDIEGRYFTNVTREKVLKIVVESTTLNIVESWGTEDKLKRKEFEWINVILKKC